MTLSLPADPPRARSLTGVVPQVFRSLDGEDGWFAASRSAIVFLVDGLGALNLRARAGHARFLARVGLRSDVARTVFPSTTAAALTSLLTATDAGRHGIAGYRLRVPETGAVVNQLRGWDTDGLDRSWLRAAPLTDEDRPTYVVSKAEYAGTGLTDAIMHGAIFVGADDLDQRMAAAAEIANTVDGAFVYLYAPELDAVGHKHGWESERWLETLERLDAAAALLARAIAPDVGLLVTADHGMVDVPRHRHVLLSEGDRLVHGVAEIGGEPRMLHLYAEPGCEDDLLDAWRDAESGRSWVLSRAEAVASGLFGAHVDHAVAARLGDVLVAARATIAYYDDRVADKAPQKMIGQHGSLTDQERIVPLLRLGAYA
ncbi:alkaline phosphatase family protein [Microbacterium awajiense]|uniref:Alkaline phosphatase family protein n=1 Tax=Microbacterium awajiense TaxID=415214 RepID=A0ABP7A5F7_9MICO